MRFHPLLCATALALCSSQLAKAASVDALKCELTRTEAEFFQHILAHGFNAGLRACMADDAMIANSLTLGRDTQVARGKGDGARSPTNSIRRNRCAQTCRHRATSATRGA